MRTFAHSDKRFNKMRSPRSLALPRDDR